MLAPNELVLTFGDCYLAATFGKNQSRNATVIVRTDRQTDGHTHRQTETEFITCSMLYAIAPGQIMTLTTCELLSSATMISPNNAEKHGQILLSHTVCFFKLKKFFLDIHLLCHIVQQEVISRSSSGAQQNLLIAYCTSHSQPIHNFTYGTFNDSQTTNLWLTAFLLAMMHLLHGQLSD